MLTCWRKKTLRFQNTGAQSFFIYRLAFKFALHTQTCA